MTRICPTCGEPCAAGWCDFCDRLLPPRGCAFTTCADPACYFCVVMPGRFRLVRCAGTDDDGEPCRFVAGHPPPCKSKASRAAKRDSNLLRDGDAATKRRDPTWTRRRREGPHR